MWPVPADDAVVEPKALIAILRFYNYLQLMGILEEALAYDLVKRVWESQQEQFLADTPVDTLVRLTDRRYLWVDNVCMDLMTGCEIDAADLKCMEPPVERQIFDLAAFLSRQPT